MKKKHYTPQTFFDFIEDDGVKRCLMCNDSKIDHHKTGDGELYYICQSCGFESKPNENF